MSSSTIEEIKSRLNIVDIIKEYLPNLKPVGANWKELCPFHSEKTPSFIVSPARQIWHCFGCNKGGNVFGFIMEQEGIDFKEALEILAQKAGVKLTPQAPQIESQKKRLITIMEEAAEFYHQILISQTGEKVRDYLKTRKIKEAIIKEFQLGEAPRLWDYLSNFLIKKGYHPNDILLTGLVISKEKQMAGKLNFYDRFRGRLIFPIRDINGRVVGLAGRTLGDVLGKAGDKEDLAKYVNSPSTLIYDKSRLLYALDRAKQEIRKKDEVIVVEGYMDVLASFSIGITEVVASGGTALTQSQLRLLKRYTNNLILSFDMDLAGQSALERGIGLALEEGMTIKVIQLGGFKDPAECIEHHPFSWEKALIEAQGFIDYYFEKTLSQFDLKKVEDKKKIAKILLGLIKKITDKVEQAHYLKKLANILDVPEGILREALENSMRTKEKTALSPLVNKRIQRDKEALLGERIIGLVLRLPQYLSFTIESLPLEMMTSFELKNIYKNLIVYYNQIKSIQKHHPLEMIFNYQEFLQLGGLRGDFPLNNRYELDRLILLAEDELLTPLESLENKEILIKEELWKNIKLLKKEYFNKQLKELKKEIAKAERLGQSHLIKELTLRFKEIAEEIRGLEEN